MLSSLKLPHWLQIVVSALVVLTAWAMQQESSGSLVLPAAAVSALTVVSTLLGLFSPAAGAPSGPSAFSRGFSSVRALAATAAAGAVICICALVTSVSGCTSAQLQNSITPGVNFAICVISTYAKEAAGVPIAQVVADEVAACGGDALNVINVLDAEESPSQHKHVAHEGVK